MTAPHPGIGEWYRLNGGQLFEVVAVDDDDGTIEIQYFDGTVEEMDVEDWESQWDEGGLEAAEAPEDWTGSVDVDRKPPAPGSDFVIVYDPERPSRRARYPMALVRCTKPF